MTYIYVRKITLLNYYANTVLRCQAFKKPEQLQRFRLQARDHNAPMRRKLAQEHLQKAFHQTIPHVVSTNHCTFCIGVVACSKCAHSQHSHLVPPGQHNRIADHNLYIIKCKQIMFKSLWEMGSYMGISKLMENK